jgi:hypothetical protein
MTCSRISPSPGRFRGVLLTALAITVAIPVKSQWLNYPDAAIPRTKDGKAELSARAHVSGHRPDLSGVWRTMSSPRQDLVDILGPNFDALDSGGSQAAFQNVYFLNILADYKDPRQSPMHPAALQIFRNRLGGPLDGFPPTQCLPSGIPAADLFPAPFRIVQTPRLIVFLYEEKGLPREIFLDGRPLPQDPQPSWMGYSVGRWDGKTLVVESAGFNDKTWLDAFGHPHSEKMHVTERFFRRDFGHMDAEITINDPEMYSKAFSVKFSQILMPDTDLLETVCGENERDRIHFKR